MGMRGLNHGLRPLADGLGGSGRPPRPPVAAFTGTPLSGDAPLEVVFTNTSTHATSWLWEKNDGGGWAAFDGTPTAANPTEDFDVGTWSVRLTATGPGGSNTLTRTGYVAAAWTPANLSSLIIWLPVGPSWCFTDAAGLIPCGNGDLIRLRKDASGNGYDFTQATSGSRPTLRLDGSGTWYCEWDGVDDRMTATVPSGLMADGFILAAAMRRSANAVQQMLLSFGNEASGQRRNLWIDLVNRLNFNGYLQDVTGSVTSDTTTDYRWIVSRTGSVVSITVNGSAAGSGSPTLDPNSQTVCSLGSNLAAGEFFGGRDYGVVATNASPSGDDLANLDAYLLSQVPP